MDVKTIFYRGALRSCNYKCPYCALRRKKLSAEQSAPHALLSPPAEFAKQFSCIEAKSDEAALNRFCDKAGELGTSLTVMLIPNGEALIHEYYHKAIAKLCTNDNISTVGCQTNLSFDIEKFAAHINGYIEKVSLWCTFHPSQVRIDDFLKQCETLDSYDIRYCVGAVAHTPNIQIIKELRTRLPDIKYMWLNAMPHIKYTAGEMDAFLQIDPLFRLETQHHIADTRLCRGGRESIFVNETGDYFACNISKVKLGNIYTEQSYNHQTTSENHAEPTLTTGEKAPVEQVFGASPQNICRAKKCSCYLAYSNRVEMSDIILNRNSIPTRNPSPQEAYFFDIDGTLTDRTGKISNGNISMIQNLSRHSLIFLATSLPYKLARRKCRMIWDYISGGVFAEGSDIRIFKQTHRKGHSRTQTNEPLASVSKLGSNSFMVDFKKIIPLDNEIFEILHGECSHYFNSTLRAAETHQNIKYVCYREDGVLHKVTAFSTSIPDHPRFNMVREKVTGIVSKDACKLNGVLLICEKLNLLSDRVTAVGNSENDVPMMNFFRSGIN